MTESTLTISIHCPPADIFNFALNPGHSPEWIDSFAHEETNEWPPRLGTIYRNRNQEGVWSEYRIESFDQDHSFVLGEVDGTYHVRYTLEAVGPSETKLTYHEWVDTGTLDEPFGIKALEKLKGILESA